MRASADPNRELRQLLAKRPLAVELFAGVGGLGLGLHQAGFHVPLALELEDVIGCYGQYNFPTTKYLFGPDRGDVRKLTSSAITDLLGQRKKDRATLVCGGAPCQGFSIAGKKRSDDPLNSLVLEFARVVSAVRPMAFLLENVPGILREGNTQLAECVRRLAKSYRVSDPTKLLASDFGVPQARHRVFLLGIRKDLGLDPSFPSPTCIRAAGNGLLFADLPAATTVWEAISDLPNVDEYEELIDSDRIPYDKPPLNDYQREMRGEHKGRDDLAPLPEWNASLCTNSRRTRHGEVLLGRLTSLGFGETDPVSKIRRLDPHRVATTIRAGSTKERGSWSPPRPLHPFQDRVITTRESARLQSFPDYFEVHPTKWIGGRMIGNAVPPKLGRAIAAHLLEILGIRIQDTDLPPSLRDESLIAQHIASAHGAGLSTRKISQTVIHPDKHGLPIGPRSRLRFKVHE
jgi:DNA (cytosine-5)-methyltransferase 1